MLSPIPLGTNDAARAKAFCDPLRAVFRIGKGNRRDESVSHGYRLSKYESGNLYPSKPGGTVAEKREELGRIFPTQ
jgi:hypothetical protein